VAANSATIIDSIGAGTGLHADFGSGLWDGGPIGIPITVVDGQTTPAYQVPFRPSTRAATRLSHGSSSMR
jgi:hypothetical protein